VKAEVRLYDRLFTKENPDDLAEGETYKDYLNSDSLKVITAMIEPAILNERELIPGVSDKFQFERIGYFSLDKDTSPGNLVFNRVVPLKDSWAKTEKVK
jgi:glutaminyl-tRNA synthetase